MSPVVNSLIVFRDKGGLAIGRVTELKVAGQYSCRCLEYSRMHRRWTKMHRRIDQSWIEVVLPSETDPADLCHRITVLENQYSAKRRAATQGFENKIRKLSREAA